MAVIKTQTHRPRNVKTCVGLVCIYHRLRAAMRANNVLIKGELRQQCSTAPGFRRGATRADTLETGLETNIVVAVSPVSRIRFQSQSQS